MKAVKRVLVVEDNEPNRVLVTDLLKLLRCEVFYATDGQEAVTLARSQRPDLILMDLQLPGLDGFTATRILKEDSQTRDIPIIGISSYAFNREKEQFEQAGGDAYLTKPFDLDQFFALVKKYLQGVDEDEGPAPDPAGGRQ